MLGAALLFAYNRLHFSKAGFNHLVSLVLFGVCYTLFFFGIFLSNTLCVVLANCCLLYGGAFELFAIMHLLERNPDKVKKRLIILLAAVSVIQAVLALIIDLSNIRIGLVTIALCVVWLHISYLLIKRKGATVLQRFVGVFYLLTTVALLLRSVAALSHHDKYTLLTPGFVQAFTFLCLFVTMIIGGIGIILLAKEREDEQILFAATYDGLTGIFNRRHFIDLARNQLAFATRKKCPFSVIMIDIDHFKHINDTYGHQKGDLVLSEFPRFCSII